MDDATQALAFCPSCEGGGAVGMPCNQPVCARRGYHYIPFQHRDILKQTPIDPLYGQMWGDYLVVDRVGSGGLGNVYLALQQPINLPAALKVLHAVDPNSDDYARFRAEAQALARLNHPNIVRLLHYGHRNDAPYMVMELVSEGRTLLDDMRKGIAPSAGFRVLLQLVNALEAAHAQGVVHRDIKPANLMLQHVPGESHYLRLVDFGLAKFVDEGSSTRVLAGTPSYMAPEQFDRRNIGPWTDFYALGALAFELLGGRRPFPGRTAAEVMALKRDPEWVPTDLLDDLGLPEALVVLLRRLLDPEPSARPQSAPELRSALRAAVPEPVVLDARDLGPGGLTELGDDDIDQTSASHSVLLGESVPPDEVDAPRAPSRRGWFWMAVAIVLGAGLTGAAIRLLADGDPVISGAAAPSVLEAPVVETVRAQPTIATTDSAPAAASLAPNAAVVSAAPTSVILAAPAKVEAKVEAEVSKIEAEAGVDAGVPAEPAVAEPAVAEPAVAEPEVAEPRKPARAEPRPARRPATPGRKTREERARQTPAVSPTTAAPALKVERL